MDDVEPFAITPSAGSDLRCRLCAATVMQSLNIRENMFGTGEVFAYEKCAGCGAVQIAELPSSLGRYYPESYYSYAGLPQGVKQKLRMYLAVSGPGFLFGRSDWWLSGGPKSIRDCGAKKTDTILDIGCGSGEFISALKEIGFHFVSGADPFVRESFHHKNGVSVRKVEMRELSGSYNVVMMHHSLEHIWDQKDAAAQLFRVVAPGGKCIVRIPTVDSWTWQNFGVDWVHADAPRHFYLHSRKSISCLLTDVGFTDIRIIDDSIAYGILGSKKIREFHRLMDPDNSPNFERYFRANVISEASKMVRRLNAESRGDSIAVHAVRPAA